MILGAEEAGLLSASQWRQAQKRRKIAVLADSDYPAYLKPVSGLSKPDAGGQDNQILSASVMGSPQLGQKRGGVAPSSGSQPHLSHL